jgi:alpha-amylase
MQRTGTDTRKGLVFILNNTGSWNGAAVQTRWPNTLFRPAAWRGHDNTDIPEPKTTTADGSADFWAPPRGYTVYLPE